ncbi:MAG: hypothetical protein KF861_13140, partial [Planctomycetaceae bacterium]|nr:hypothetical protein [Planctomycetaceae bacterium]
LGTLQRQARLWGGAAVLGLLLAAANQWLSSPPLSAGETLVCGLVLLIATWGMSRRTGPSLRETAVAIEQRWPSLDSRLVTAIGLQPDQQTQELSYLQQEVMSEALLHAHRHDWRETVPLNALGRAKALQMASLSAFVVTIAAAAWAASTRPAVGVDPMLADDANRSATFDVTLEPGDVEIERDSSLLVVARFAGRMPAEVLLHATDSAGTTSSFPLSRSLDDPLFGGRIPDIDTDLSYHVTFSGQQSDAYRVKVFDYPELERADARIDYPVYTGREAKLIEDVRRVSVIEGSQLTLTCRLNKPVEAAVLQNDVDDSERALDLSPEGNGSVWSVQLTPRTKQTLRLLLTDAEGRTNRNPPEFVIDVIPNRPPELAVAFPGRDVRVSPLEEVALEANAEDDFGLLEYGLVYQLPRQEETTLALGQASERDAKVVLTHQLALEDAAAEPNELVAYYFYADDFGPDGDIRRTFSDMYFAEVRHFDEEYRQSANTQAPAAGSPGGETPSTQLLQLQREIVSAAWNLIRRERGTEPSSAFQPDVRTIAESQQHAIQQGQQLQSRQEDALALQYLQEALAHMALADEALSTAGRTPTLEPLPSARRAAYDAYQSLVKLQMREHLVQQSQSQSSSQSSQSPGDLNRQLQQLELQNNRNRYETEQQDQAPADREQLQVLNRLRELARRQQSLNEKIQELENALRAAANEQERREIERQLKRLQEEQQQMLRDLDELQERMNNEQNRSRMAAAREQAENVRDHLLRTSEALQEGQTSQAIASGTRAERELNQMQDQLREQTSGQFAETLRELRQEARELTEHQQQLADKLGGNTQQQQPTKGGPPQLKEEEGDPLHEEFAAQRERLRELMDRLKAVVQESELSEPLLSKTLYDAVRNTRSDRPEEALDMASRFLRHGLNSEAERAESMARAGIDKLRDGIEKAAESVLGNEIESLRRAQREVDGLSRAIASELAQGAPQASNPNGEPRETGEPNSPGDNARGQESTQEPTPGSDPSTAGNGGERSRGRTADRRPGEPSESDAAGDAADRDAENGENSGPSSAGEPSGQSSSGSESPSEQAGRSEQGEQPGQASNGALSGSASEPSGPSPLRGLSNFLPSESVSGGGGTTRPGGMERPLTGGDFAAWSDRLRDVEEMVDDPSLRARAAQIRDRARQMRIDLKQRHSESPNWDLVRSDVYGPLLELRDRLAEEIARREPTDGVVPLDRDPVPDRYTELVERYYERLGSGR